MVRTLATASLAALLLACGGDDDGPADHSASPADAPAAVAATPRSRAPAAPGGDLAAEADPYLAGGEVPVPLRSPAGPRPRSLEITLRSTPAGATAAVDGEVVGVTPTFWRGPMTGQAREFTFSLPDHVTARYRFVPTTSGVVHATLDPLLAAHDAAP